MLYRAKRIRVAVATIVLCCAVALAACGSSKSPSASAPAQVPVTEKSATLDDRCAAAVPQSVAPPQGQFATPTGYQSYHQAAQAVSRVLRGADRSSKLASVLPGIVRQVQKAARDYKKDASLLTGSGDAPYPLANATIELAMAYREVTAAGLPACARALHRLAADASGSLGQPANPASCASGQVPVGGGCVSKQQARM